MNVHLTAPTADHSHETHPKDLSPTLLTAERKFIQLNIRTEAANSHVIVHACHNGNEDIHEAFEKVTDSAYITTQDKRTLIR